MSSGEADSYELAKKLHELASEHVPYKHKNVDYWYTEYGKLIDRLAVINNRVNLGLGEGTLNPDRWRDALIDVGVMLDDAINDED